jgi:peptide/nickel transport system permease protein
VTGPTRSRARVHRLAPPALALAALALLALAAPWLAPAPPNAIPGDGLLTSLPPSLEHPFGTDPLGRDVLSRVLHGARVSLSVAVLSVALSSLLGTAYGAAAGWCGGWIDTVATRLLDVVLAVPRVMLLLVVSALWGPLPLHWLVLLLGITGWFDVARLVRSEVRALREREFVLAARASGVRGSRILWWHVVPHVWPTLAVTATLGVAHTVALEAGLSFLGLGVQPPQASWGMMLTDGAIPGLGRWWLMLFPGGAIVAAVLAGNALSDALRETATPRQVGA